MLKLDPSSSFIPSILDSMHSWLTPAVLFLLLNLMIATIALSSSLSNNNNQNNNKSPLIQRLRSINLSPFKSQPSITQTHQHDNLVPITTHHHDNLVPTTTHQPENLVLSLEDVFSETEPRDIARTKSDTDPVEKKLPARIRKSASMKSAFGHFEESSIVEAQRPATVREGKGKVTEGDDEVDAKADDFINRFKNQLKLQRMDSIVRYKEMIGRGGGN